MRDRLSRERIFQGAALARMFSVNSDIMIRTLCLMFGVLFFTAQGAKAGDIPLAANAVLFEFVTVFAYLLDGFAVSAEVLTGGAVGGRRLDELPSGVLAVLAVGGDAELRAERVLLADRRDADRRDGGQSRGEGGRAGLSRLGRAGAGHGRHLLSARRRVRGGDAHRRHAQHDGREPCRLSSVAWAVLTPVYGNHGLWASLMVFYAVRGMTLATRYPALVRATFPIRK